MNKEDEFRVFVRAYYGVDLMDEYPLKLYVLADLEKRIRDIVKKGDFSYSLTSEAYELSKCNEIDKLNDALYVMKLINYKIDFIIMLNHKIKELKSR